MKRSPRKATAVQAPLAFEPEEPRLTPSQLRWLSTEGCVILQLTKVRTQILSSILSQPTFSYADLAVQLSLTAMGVRIAIQDLNKRQLILLDQVGKTKMSRRPWRARVGRALAHLLAGTDASVA